MMKRVSEIYIPLIHVSGLGSSDNKTADVRNSNIGFLSRSRNYMYEGTLQN